MVIRKEINFKKEGLNMTKTICVVVKITVKESTDLNEMIEEMDYNFIHAGILDTEIIESIEKEK
jgi:hypothetical protein